METGNMLLLLEALPDSVPSGVFFGASNPNNWSVKDSIDELCAGNPSPKEMASTHFQIYAKMHATYWKSDELLVKPWLNGSTWAKGEGEAQWQASQSMSREAWAKCEAAIEAGNPAIQWDPHVVACLKSSFSKVSWEEYQARLATSPFTLVHGDAHAHNALWVDQRTEAARLCLIDFEMVGVGSAGQELGQYMISHMPPEERRREERCLVEEYHIQLCANLQEHGQDTDTYTLETCWEEYVAGGVGRWAWFLPLFMGMPAMAQFFHDQLAAFLADHVPDPATAPMPRV